MVDGSALSLEDNITWTRKMVKIAHEAGVAVEAELGRLAGEEVGIVTIVTHCNEDMIHNTHTHMLYRIDICAFISKLVHLL
jgi:fructose/tagatose bisphosphate aldolase